MTRPKRKGVETGFNEQNAVGGAEKRTKGCGEENYGMRRRDAPEMRQSIVSSQPSHEKNIE